MKIDQKITTDNAIEMMNKVITHPERLNSQAKAWSVVHNLCTQLGMYDQDVPEEWAGIQRVVDFITKAAEK